MQLASVLFLDGDHDVPDPRAGRGGVVTIIPPAQLSSLPTRTVSVPRYSLLYIEDKVSLPELRTRSSKDEGSPLDSQRKVYGCQPSRRHTRTRP